MVEKTNRNYSIKNKDNVVKYKLEVMKEILNLLSGDDISYKASSIYQESNLISDNNVYYFKHIQTLVEYGFINSTVDYKSIVSQNINGHFSLCDTYLTLTLSGQDLIQKLNNKTVWKKIINITQNTTLGIIKLVSSTALTMLIEKV